MLPLCLDQQNTSVRNGHRPYIAQTWDGLVNRGERENYALHRAGRPNYDQARQFHDMREIPLKGPVTAHPPKPPTR
jgi:hypothetical protein